jgi:hypothetical protein
LAKIRIEGYLLQKKLQEALLQIVGSQSWKGIELNLDEKGLRKYKWDMGYFIDGNTTYVEFDGHIHYQSPENIGRDKFKDQLLFDRKILTVRIPYWVQLTSETLHHYFGLEAEIIQNFPHGFITTKEYPSSYCEMGLERFRSELSKLPESVRNDVINSLEKRAAEHRFGRKFVIPECLENEFSR